MQIEPVHRMNVINIFMCFAMCRISFSTDFISSRIDNSEGVFAYIFFHYMTILTYWDLCAFITANCFRLNADIRKDELISQAELFFKGEKDKIWQNYCGFLDLNLKEYMEIREDLLLQQIEKVSKSQLGQKIMKSSQPKTVEEFRKAGKSFGNRNNRHGFPC